WGALIMRVANGHSSCFLASDTREQFTTSARQISFTAQIPAASHPPQPHPPVVFFSQIADRRPWPPGKALASPWRLCQLPAFKGSQAAKRAKKSFSRI